MDATQQEQMLLTLVGGSIRGMKNAWDDLNRSTPGVYPSVDDAVMFDVACMLAGTVIEASPEYEDPKRFAKGADMARGKVLDEIRHARKMGDALGTKMLYKHIEAATGMGPVTNDR